MAPWLIAGAYLAYFDRFVPAAGATLLKREMGMNDGTYGLIVGTLFALSYALASLAIGRIARDAWRGLLLTLGLAAWTSGSIALALVRDPWGFAAAQLAIGAGQAAFVPAAVATLAQGSSMRFMGRATANFTIASTLGRSSAVLIAGSLITAIGGIGLFSDWGLAAPWRATFLITAIPNLVVGIGVLLFMIKGANAAPVAQSEPSPSAGPPIAGLFVAASAAIVLTQSVAMWFPTVLVRVGGLDTGRAAMLVGAVTLATAPLGQWLGGRVTDRFTWLSAVPTRAVVGGLATALLLLSLLLLRPPPAGVLALLGLTNLALGVASLAALAGLQRATPPERRARANSYFFATITMIGLGSGPLLVGVISDARGETTGLVPALCMVAALTLIVAAIGHAIARHMSRSAEGIA